MTEDALLSALQLRKEFGRELEEDMAGLGEEAFTYHHAYVFATATR